MTTASEMPPTNLHNADAVASLRFYAKRFASGETKRWDLAAHLLEQAAEVIERAIADERKRCAEVARAARNNAEFYGNPDMMRAAA